jgi:hypothetical protein
MKKLLLYVTVVSSAIFCVQSHAAEMHLLCSGTKTFLNLPAGSGQKTEKDKWEVIFDESKKNEGGVRFTVNLAQGCFPLPHLKGEKCECRITADEIRCDSAVVGITNQTYRESSFFKVNRFSGRLSGLRSITYRDQVTQRDDWYTVEVEAICEVFERKKF